MIQSQEKRSTKKSTKLINRVYAWLSKVFKPKGNWFAGPVVFNREIFVTRDGHEMILRISYEFIDVFDVAMNTWVMSIGDVAARSRSGEVQMTGNVIMIAQGRPGTNYLVNNYAIKELFQEGTGLYHVSFIQLGDDMFIPIDPGPGDCQIRFKQVVLGEDDICGEYIPIIRKKIMTAGL